MENLEILFGTYELIVKVLALLFGIQYLLLLGLDDLFELCFGQHHDVVVILLTI